MSKKVKSDKSVALGTGDGTDTVQVQSFLLPYEGVAEKSNTNSQL